MQCQEVDCKRAVQREPARFNLPGGWEPVVFCQEHVEFVGGGLPPERIGPASVVEGNPPPS